MKNFVTKYGIYFVLLGIVVFYWMRYRTAPTIAFSETASQELNGDKIMLGDLIQGPTVVHFYATWCGPCMKEMREINKVADDLHAKEIQFLFVSDDPIDRMKITKDGKSEALHFVHVESLQALGIYTIPTSYFIGSDGVVKKEIVDVCAWENPDFCNEIIEITK